MFSHMMYFGQPMSAKVLLVRIFAAVVVGALIGIDREIKNRPAGMRTHVLVCVGAAKNSTPPSASSEASSRRR